MTKISIRKGIAAIAASALAAACALVFAGCGGEEREPIELPGPVHDDAAGFVYGESVDVVGNWYAAPGAALVTLELGEDGTYTMDMVGADAATTGRWELGENSVVLDGDEESALLIAGDTLMQPGGLTFLRGEAAGYTPGEVVAASSVAAFNGYWKSAYVETEGDYLPSALAGDDTFLYGEDGRVALGGSLFGDTVADFEFVDGALLLESGSVSVTLEMQSDLMIRATLTGRGETLVLILNQADDSFITG